MSGSWHLHGKIEMSSLISLIGNVIMLVSSFVKLYMLKLSLVVYVGVPLHAHAKTFVVYNPVVVECH
jgi:hypothetical protein